MIFLKTDKINQRFFEANETYQSWKFFCCTVKSRGVSRCVLSLDIFSAFFLADVTSCSLALRVLTWNSLIFRKFFSGFWRKTVTLLLHPSSKNGSKPKMGQRIINSSIVSGILMVPLYLSQGNFFSLFASALVGIFGHFASLAAF